MLVGSYPAYTKVDPRKARVQAAFAEKVAMTRAPVVVPERRSEYFYEAQRPTRRGAHLTTPHGRPSALSFDQLQMLELEAHGPKVRISNMETPIEVWVDDPNDNEVLMKAEGRKTLRKILKKVSLESSLLMDTNTALDAVMTAIKTRSLDDAATMDAVKDALLALVTKLDNGSLTPQQTAQVNEVISAVASQPASSSYAASSAPSIASTGTNATFAPSFAPSSIGNDNPMMAALAASIPDQLLGTRALLTSNGTKTELGKTIFLRLKMGYNRDSNDVFPFIDLNGKTSWKALRPAFEEKWIAKDDTSADEVEYKGTMRDTYLFEPRRNAFITVKEIRANPTRAQPSGPSGSGKKPARRLARR